MGLRERQILSGVEIPLAAPVIVGGFRTAVLNVIATATIGAVLGFGGLGRFILDGRAMGLLGTGQLIGGAILVSVLAVGIDLLLAVVQRRLARRADPAARRTRAACASCPRSRSPRACPEAPATVHGALGYAPGGPPRPGCHVLSQGRRPNAVVPRAGPRGGDDGGPGRLLVGWGQQARSQDRVGRLLREQAGGGDVRPGARGRRLPGGPQPGHRRPPGAAARPGAGPDRHLARVRRLRPRLLRQGRAHRRRPDEPPAAGPGPGRQEDPGLRHLTGRGHQRRRGPPGHRDRARSSPR